MTTSRYHCNSCHSETNHKTIGEPIIHSIEPITWYLWQCQGCDDVFLLKEVLIPTGRTDEDEEEEEVEPSFERIPPKVEYRLPNWVNSIKEEVLNTGDYQYVGQVETSIRQIVKEIYVALNHGALNLACTGMRTVLECVFRDKLQTNLPPKSGFSKKLAAMVEAGLLSEHKKEILHAVIEVGNAAVHRGFTPPKHIVDEALDITEGLLREVYLHPVSARAIRAITPMDELAVVRTAANGKD